MLSARSAAGNVGWSAHSGEGANMADNRKVVEKAVNAIQERDLDVLAEVMHSDITVSYPQSGEVIRGRDNYLAMLANYPSLPETEVNEVRGEGDQVQVVTPMPFSLPTVTVIGSGDTFVLEGVSEYSDGAVYHHVSILKLRDGKVIEDASYFGSPFDPPAWRVPYVAS